MLHFIEYTVCEVASGNIAIDQQWFIWLALKSKHLDDIAFAMVYGNTKQMGIDGSADLLLSPAKLCIMTVDAVIQIVRGASILSRY